MGLLSFPKASRKLQRSLKNIRVSFLCFLLTFLVLRNTIGAGKFGTPAQDFEEIRLHLHNVGLHRKHFRVLTKAVEEEKPPSLMSPEEKRRSTLIDFEGGESQSNAVPVAKAEKEDIPSKTLHLTEKSKDMNAHFSILKEMQGIAVSSTRDVNRHNSPLIAIGKGGEGFRLSGGYEQRKLRKALAHGQPKVLVVLDLQSAECEKFTGESLFLKSLKNKVDYSTLHDFEVFTGLGGLNAHSSESISRLSLLQGVMLNNPDAEWLWWLPHEAVIVTDMAFELPLQTYMEFNLVLFGDVGTSYHKKQLMIDLKKEIFLIRNCQWSVELLERSGKMAFMSPDVIHRKSEHSVENRHANVISVNQQERESRGKVHVEHSAVLRGEWHDVALKFESSSLHPYEGAGAKQLPFVTDFLGCKLSCLADKNDGMCYKEIERVVMWVEKQFGSRLESVSSRKPTLM